MLKRIKWKPRPADIFDGEADTRNDMAAVPPTCAAGSIVYIKAEDLFVVKRSDGVWQELPGRLFAHPEYDTIEKRE